MNLPLAKPPLELSDFLVSHIICRQPHRLEHHSDTQHRHQLNIMFGFQIENRTTMTSSRENKILRHAEMVGQVKVSGPDLIPV